MNDELMKRSNGTVIGKTLLAYGVASIFILVQGMGMEKSEKARMKGQ